MLDRRQVDKLTRTCENDAQRLFVARVCEQVSAFSHASQRVKLHNGRTCLRELLRVAEECVYNRINFLNFSNVMEELGSLTTKDPVFIKALPYYAQFFSTINKATEIKEKEKALESLLTFIRRGVSDCDKQYAGVLKKLLLQALVNNNVQDTATLCELLISDYIGRGEYIWITETTVSVIFENHNTTFLKQVQTFFLYMSRDSRKMEVTFALRINQPNHLAAMATTVQGMKISTEVALNPGDDVPPVFRSRMDEFTFYATVEVEAKQPVAAVRAAKAALGVELDLLKVAAPLLDFGTPYPYAIVQDGKVVVNFSITDEEVGYRRGTIERIQKLYPKAMGILDQLRTNNPRDFDRLASSMRYFRLGSSEGSAEAKFLNLWIGLEYLLRVGGYDSDISAVRDLLPKVTSVSFLRDRLETFYGDLRRSHVKIPGILHPQRTRRKAVAALTLLHDATRLAALKTNAGDSPLLVQRLEQTALWANDAAKTTELMDAHINRVVWQIQRMYRVRNSIVHSGTKDENLTLLTANLQEYLESAILLVIDNIGDDNYWSIDQTFRHLKTLYEYMREQIKAAKKAPLPSAICFPYSSVGLGG